MEGKLHPCTPPAAAIRRISAQASWLETALIFVVFFVQGGWPAPDVNESHYMPKARAFWDRQWLAGDFFLDSADAHVMFYATAGWLAAVLPFSAAAWCGRLLTWALLAWAWRRLSHALIPQRWYALLSAALFVTLLEYGHAGGEWVIGGFEAKGFAFVLAFLGLEQIARDRWNRGLAWLGAAAAFHVLVGGWLILCVAFSWLLQGERRPRLQALWPGLAAGLLLSLPGLLPALKLTMGADAATVDEASRIQVFARLGHHLDPYAIMEQAPWRVARHASLAVAALALFAANWKKLDCRRLGGVVVGGVLIALLAFALAYGLPKNPALSARLLRFYWLRASDLLAPLGVALLGCRMLADSWQRRRALSTALVAASLGLCGAHLGWLSWHRWDLQLAGLLIPRADLPLAEEGVGEANDAQTQAARRYADWLAICRQARKRTPESAVFITPRHAQTFHWHAERREVANWKDMPQDATALVEWFDRVARVDGLHRPGAAAAALAGRYGADYLITDAVPALPHDGPWRRIARNDSFALYRLTRPGEKPGGTD